MAVRTIESLPQPLQAARQRFDTWRIESSEKGKKHTPIFLKRKGLICMAIVTNRPMATVRDGNLRQ